MKKMKSLEDIIGLEVVSSDAKLIGELDGIGIDINTWTAPVVRFCLKKGMDGPLGVKKPLFGAACLLIESSYIERVSDVITLTRTMGEIRSLLIERAQVPLMAGEMVGKRVVGKNGREIGVVETIVIDTDKGWAVPQIKVRLDKYVVEELNLKKTILSTPLIGISTKDIRTVGDLVMLSIATDQLKGMLEKS